MILIKVGTQKSQFNRLLKYVDELVEKGVITEEVFAQTGASDYKPAHYAYKTFMPKPVMEEWNEKADIVITHGGTASIMESVRLGKKVIAVPRKAEFGEHIDDHQKEIVQQLSDGGIIEACMEVEDLPQALENVRIKEYMPYVSNKQAVIDQIREWIG